MIGLDDINFTASEENLKLSMRRPDEVGSTFCYNVDYRLRMDFGNLGLLMGSYQHIERK